MIDLQLKDLEIVRTVLKAFVPQYDVWAFGSRVSHRARPFSDLDLAIIADHPLGFEKLGDIHETFSLSDLPIKVDVLDWACITESFREIIRSQYEIIQHGEAQLNGVGLGVEYRIDLEK
jgi:predicted nucleotidyltransferase